MWHVCMRFVLLDLGHGCSPVWGKSWHLCKITVRSIWLKNDYDDIPGKKKISQLFMLISHLYMVVHWIKVLRIREEMGLNDQHKYSLRFVILDVCVWFVFAHKHLTIQRQRLINALYASVLVEAPAQHNAKSVFGFVELLSHIDPVSSSVPTAASA